MGLTPCARVAAALLAAAFGALPPAFGATEPPVAVGRGAANLLRLPEPEPATVIRLRLTPASYHRKYITVDLAGIAAAHIEPSRTTVGAAGEELQWYRLSSIGDPASAERVDHSELLFEMDAATGRQWQQALADTRTGVTTGTTARVRCLFLHARRTDHCRVYVVELPAAGGGGSGARTGRTRFGLRSVVEFDRLSEPEQTAALARFFPDHWKRVASPTP